MHEQAIASAVPETSLDPKVIAGRTVTDGAACVRGAEIDDADFAALLSEMGEMMVTPGETEVPGYPMLNVVTNAGRDTPPVSRWHSDTTYVARPPIFTGLRVVEVPEEGGATLVIDTRPLWDELSNADKGRLATVRVLHKVSGVEPPEGSETEAMHPLVRRQPETGRVGFFQTVPERTPAALYLDGEEASGNVRLFYERARKLPAMKHTWRPGDLLFWDNRVTLHKGDHSAVKGVRTLHRGMVRGEVPVCVDPADFALAAE
ncbi:MAG: TauD/TfdA family dioxygenase [Pseudomonadota bacterium]